MLGVYQGEGFPPFRANKTHFTDKVRRNILRTICDKRFVEGRRKTCVREGGCVHGAFNVETVEGKVGRLASNAPQS